MPDKNYEMKIVFAGDPIIKVFQKYWGNIRRSRRSLGDKKQTKTQSIIMLNFLDANNSNFLKKLEQTLSKRKYAQNNKLSEINKIISDVQKFGDKALIKYEKKFLKIKSKKINVKFSKNEINKISKKIDNRLKSSIDCI